MAHGSGPHPKLLNGRPITCHPIVMADLLNTGANIVFERGVPAKVVVDDDLVTAYSKAEVIPFVESIAEQVLMKSRATSSPKVQLPSYIYG